MSRIHGLLLLDKPAGISSHSAMRRAQRLLGVSKAGHTGSLDPLATGMLPVCLGEATKFAQYWLEAGKAYAVRLRLGVSTDTGDKDGQVIASAPVPALELASVETLLAQWRGLRPQVPPMYAAIKHQGRPLYWFARQGIEVPRPARMVEISDLRLTALEGEEMALFVACSKGTYIRALVTEIGEALGCGAHVLTLHRAWVHPFEQLPMVSLEALEALDLEARWTWVHPTGRALAHIPVQAISATAANRLYQGQGVSLEGAEDARVQLHVEGDFIGMGECTAGMLRPLRLLARASSPSVERA